MKLLFENTKGIHDECTTMQTDETKDREDREILISYFNGKPPFTEAELESLGLKLNVNFLTGHQVIADSVDQLNSVFTMQTDTWRFVLKEVDNQDKVNKKKWEQRLTRKINEVIKDSKRMANHFEAVCGEAVMWATGGFFKEDPKDWLWKSINQNSVMVPRGTELDIEKLTHWCFESSMTIIDIHDKYLAAKEDEDSHWKAANLKNILDDAFDKESTDGTNLLEYYGASDYTENRTSELRRTNSDVDSTMRTTVKIFIFYQVELETGAISKTVLLRYPFDNTRTQADAGNLNDSSDYKELVLYQNHEEAEGIDEVYIPVHLTTNIGGDPLWHDAVGLGHLNYALDEALEKILNRMLESFDDSMRTMFSAEGADPEEIEAILASNNMVLPEGVALAENRVLPKYQEAFGLLNYFSQLQERNSRGSYSNTGDSNTDKLEVQFRAEQDSKASRQANQVSKFVSRLEVLGMQVFESLVNDIVVEEDLGYAQAKEVRAFVNAQKIPNKYLKIENVKCKLARIPGDGNKQRANQIYLHYANQFEKFPPESHGRILNMMTAIATGDFDEADVMAPYEDQEADKTQQREALQENNISLVQGIKPPISVTDVDMVHLPIHLMGLQNQIQRVVQMQKVTAFDNNAFRELGAHTNQHIKRMQAMDQGKQSKMFTQQLMALSSQWERVVKALGGLPEENGEENLEKQIKMAELQLKQREQERKERRDQTDVERWTITQQNREDQGEFQKMIQSGHLDIARAKLMLDQQRAEMEAVEKLIERMEQGDDEQGQNNKADTAKATT